MANKIPVGRSIGGAYSFAFGNILNNIGEIWIPLAILCVVMFFFQKPYLDAVTGMAAQDPQAAMRILPLFFGIFVAMTVLLTAIHAGLTKEALGLRRGSAFLQFPFGAGTWRLLGANLLLMVVMWVIYFAAVIIGLVGGILLAVIFGGQNGNPAVVGLIVGVCALIFVGALIYILARFSFLLAPVTIAENRISLIRAWQLTRGSFWRIFVILLVLLIPVVILEMIVFVLFIGRDLFAGFHPGMTPQEIVQQQQQQMVVVRQVMERMSGYWFVTYPLSFLVTAVIYGMFAGASAAAYKAVVPSDGTPEAEAMS